MRPKGLQKHWEKARLDRRLCLPRWPNGRSRNRPRIPQFLRWLQAHTFSTAPCLSSKCCLRKHWLKRPIWIRTGLVWRQTSEFFTTSSSCSQSFRGLPFQYDVLTQHVIWQAFPLHCLSCQLWLPVLLHRKALCIPPPHLWSSDTNTGAWPGCCSHVFHPWFIEVEGMVLILIPSLNTRADSDVPG